MATDGRQHLHYYGYPNNNRPVLPLNSRVIKFRRCLLAGRITPPGVKFKGRHLGKVEVRGGERSHIAQTARLRETLRRLAVIDEGFVEDQARIGLRLPAPSALASKPWGCYESERQ